MKTLLIIFILTYGSEDPDATVERVDAVYSTMNDADACVKSADGVNLSSSKNARYVLWAACIEPPGSN
jgi:hypothetical protein